MPSTDLFLRNTQTEGGTGGAVYDLSTTQGTGATLGSGNIGSTTFAEIHRFQMTVDDTVDNSSIPVSLDISAFSASTVELRWRVQRINSSNAVQASSAYSSTYNTAGIKTETMTLSTTWATGDRLALSIEFRKVSGAGNRNYTLNINDADSKVSPSLPAAPDALTVVASIESLTEITKPTIGQVHVLTPSNVASLTELTQPTLGQVHVLTVANIESTTELTKPTATHIHVLAPSNIESLTELTQPAIGQVHHLIVGNIESLTELTAPVIGQIHVLAPANTESLSEITKPTAGLVSTVNDLTVNNVESASEITKPTLTQIHGLTVNNVASLTELTPPTLAQVHVLTVNSIESLTEITKPALDGGAEEPIRRRNPAIKSVGYQMNR